LPKNFVCGESEGGAGIHFPHTPFSSRPARAIFGFSAPPRRSGAGQLFFLGIFDKISASRIVYMLSIKIRQKDGGFFVPKLLTATLFYANIDGITPLWEF